MTEHAVDGALGADFAGQRVLVTGAAGFIGSSLCRVLLKSGADVHGTSRKRQPANGVRWWQTDLSEPKAITRVMLEVRPFVVFHLASHVSGDRDPSAVQPTLRDNLLTTVNLLAAAIDADGPRVLLAGSMEECDPTAAPGSPYAAAKTAAGAYAQMFHALYDLPVVHLRLHMVYGPGKQDMTKLIPYVITALLRGEQPRLTSGTREVDWIYVDDVVSAFIAAAKAPAADAQPVDVGSGHLITIRSMVDQLADLIGGEARPLFGALDDRPLERRRVADVERAQDLIGWQPRTPLRAGLEQTVRWFRSEHDRTLRER